MWGKENEESWKLKVPRRDEVSGCGKGKKLGWGHSRGKRRKLAVFPSLARHPEYDCIRSMSRREVVIRSEQARSVEAVAPMIDEVDVQRSGRKQNRREQVDRGSIRRL